MSLFGGLFKAVGKVAKAGLSVATHGVSDKVLSVLKRRGSDKQVIHSPDLTTQQEALVNKLKPLHPKTVRTEQVLASVRGTVAQVGKKRMPGRKKGWTAVQRAGGSMYDEDADYKYNQELKKRRPRGTVKKRRTPAGASKRTVPRGGLDLAKIGVLWRSQGKPGTWLDFVKANKNIRKA